MEAHQEQSYTCVLKFTVFNAKAFITRQHDGSGKEVTYFKKVGSYCRDKNTHQFRSIHHHKAA